MADIIGRANKLILEDNTPDTLLIINELRNLRAEHQANLRPSVQYEELLNQMYKRDMNREEGVPLGYRLTKFKDIEQNIDGVQPGLYMLDAETNIGKTTILCNLARDIMVGL